jgi:hypothetical protein
MIERRRGVDVIETLPSQPGLVHTCPGLPTRIRPALAQQQFGQSMTHPHQVSAGVLTGPDQIPGRLHFLLRDSDRGDLSQAQQPGQMRGVAGIGLDPIPRRPDQLRRRRDRATDLILRQCPGQPKSRGPSLIGHSHRSAQPA